MNVEIAERLAARRKQAGLSQEALAEQLGVSRQAVSKWERSESSPDTDNLIALAQLYGVSLDELLYVDDAIRDDVAFEARDRAAAQEPPASNPASGPASDSATPGDSESASEGTRKSSPSQKVKIGPGGIHVLDGDDYVHVSWREGVHVKDSRKGDEVHVGWDGIHVKEVGASGKAQTTSDASATTQEANCSTLQDDEVAKVIIDEAGVDINGEHFDSWREAHERYGYGHACEGRWNEPCGYTVNDERFDTLDEARAKYGPEVGRTIPVRKHYLREFEKEWVKFPYPLVIIVVYLLLGILNGAWGMGLFLFFTIPVYYMVGHAIGRRRLGPLVGGVYPIAVTAWFCYMAFVMNQPHPAWVAFLTIPLVEWLVHSLSRWWRARKRRRAAAKTAPLDVEANSQS